MLARRLLCVVQPVSGRRALSTSPAGTSDGDGGSGGDPSQRVTNAKRDGIEFFNPPGSITPFSRAVRAGIHGASMACNLPLCRKARPKRGGSPAGGVVYISGTGTGTGCDGKPRVGTATEETEWALENVTEILTQTGSSLARVVSVTCLIKDQSEYAEINAAYVRYWESAGISRDLLPARSTTVGFAGGAGKVGFGCVALASDQQ